MNRIILKLVLVSAVILLSLTSCDTGPTVQSYYIDSQEKEGFITTTIPKSILGLDVTELSPESQKAYNSVNKVNVLMLPATDDQEDRVAQETAAFNDILKNGNYKTLMTHNAASGMKVRFVYEGDTDSIDELIVFGSLEDKGMAVARLTGDDMNIGNLMKMMQELDADDINPANVKGILEELGMNPDSKTKRDTTETTTDSTSSVNTSVKSI
jgi:hypothetical protein